MGQSETQSVDALLEGSAMHGGLFLVSLSSLSERPQSLRCCHCLGDSNDAEEACSEVPSGLDPRILPPGDWCLGLHCDNAVSFAVAFGFCVRILDGLTNQKSD